MHGRKEICLRRKTITTSAGFLLIFIFFQVILFTVAREMSGGGT